MQIVINKNYKDKIDSKSIQDLYDQSLSLDSTSQKGVRGQVLRKKINQIDLVTRLYRRGGLVRYFSESSFLKPFFGGKFRPLTEFEILEQLQALNVPQVVAVGIKEKILTYTGIIITENIEDSLNFLNDKPNDDSLIETIAYNSGLLAKKIVTQGVFHPDLHVGNVMYKKNGEVFIIDFDKASRFKKENRKIVIEKLIKRWNKSVNKFLASSASLYSEPFLKAISK